MTNRPDLASYDGGGVPRNRGVGRGVGHRGRQILLSLLHVIGGGTRRRIRVCIYAAAFFSVIGGVLLVYSYLQHYVTAADARAMIGEHISQVEEILAVHSINRDPVHGIYRVPASDVDAYRDGRLNTWSLHNGTRAHACAYDRRGITWISLRDRDEEQKNWEEDLKANDVRSGAERCSAYLDHALKGRLDEYCHSLAENCGNDAVSLSEEGRGIFVAIRREDYFPMSVQCMYPHVRFSKACGALTASEGWLSILNPPYSFWSLITFMVGLISIGIARTMIRPLSLLQEGVGKIWSKRVGRRGSKTDPSHLSMLTAIDEQLENQFASPGFMAGRKILEGIYRVAKSVSHHQSHLSPEDEERNDKYKAETFSHLVKHVGKEMDRMMEICLDRDLGTSSSESVYVEKACEAAVYRVRKELEEEDSEAQKSKGSKRRFDIEYVINWRQQVHNLFLEEIFYHLFVNSTKHVKEGEMICRVRVDVKEKENVYAISVVDDGKGLESDKKLSDFIRPDWDGPRIGLMSVNAWVMHYRGEFYAKDKNPKGYSGLGVEFTVPKAK